MNQIFEERILKNLNPKCVKIINDLFIKQKLFDEIYEHKVTHTMFINRINYSLGNYFKEKVFDDFKNKKINNKEMPIFILPLSFKTRRILIDNGYKTMEDFINKINEETNESGTSCFWLLKMKGLVEDLGVNYQY